jgi:RNase H-fold protein (predicted Holliday junction resolvase)
MPSKETIIVGEDDKEIRNFLELLRASKELSVKFGGERFTVKIAREEVTKKGRTALTLGGPDTSED